MINCFCFWAQNYPFQQQTVSFLPTRDLNFLNESITSQTLGMLKNPFTKDKFFRKLKDCEKLEDDYHVIPCQGRLFNKHIVKHPQKSLFYSLNGSQLSKASIRSGTNSKTKIVCSMISVMNLAQAEWKKVDCK